jgi:hypothetical protein
MVRHRKRIPGRYRLKSSTIRIVALIVLVVGAAALVYGIVSFVEYRDSLAGRGAGLARDITRSVVGSGNVGLTDIEKRAVVFMVAGGIGIVVGGALLANRKRR